MPSHLHLRKLQGGDYHKGYLDLLGQLTVVGDVTEPQFVERVAEIDQRGQDYHVAVIEDTASAKVVATGTLLIERKILRNCGLVGHIEDIVVDGSVRGQHLGQRIITELTLAAERAGCYKVILDCSESNAPFYEKCGFRRKEIQMAKYFV